MTEIIIIRHGETDWNAERRLQGHTDIGLNQQGERQAQALSLALQDEHLDAIITSDLLRAKITAQAIAEKHGAKMLIDVDLRERCYGGFEGLTYAEIGQRYPEAYAAWQARELDAVMPSGERAGESLNQFFQRAHTSVLGWAHRHQGKKIVLVTHGGVLECAYRSALAMPINTPRDFAILNAAINRFSFQNGTLSMIQWGDTSHLDALALDEVDLHTP